ncbi:MAG: acylneuraminate cytidylyltransferase family protein [Alphaproteobacteria bacterium]|nr:acylneuraminate cytidylyltransferase family protein [Alphaproteobacteria bacterium]
MIAERRVLAVVAARGGSRGLPGKNLLPLGGRPVVAWSILAARASGIVDRTVLSTDDPAIARAGRDAGGEVPFLRPAELATDEASVHDALIHALEQVGDGFDYVVLLQAASPLRTAVDIDGAIRTCVAAGAPVCISVAPVDKVYWSFHLTPDGRLQTVLGPEWQARRRQDLPPAYAPNGAVYVAQVDWYRQHRVFIHPDTVAYVMPPERSFDLDTALDMKVISAVFAAETGG